MRRYHRPPHCRVMINATTKHPLPRRLLVSSPSTLAAAKRIKPLSKYACLPCLAPLTDISAIKAEHSASVFCNWVVPGLLMVGRYPHMSPSCGMDMSEADARVAYLVSQGCHKFLSLQAETPSQMTMVKTGGKSLAGSGFVPYVASAEAAADKLRIPRKSLDFNHFPIPDYDVPTFDNLVKYVQHTAHHCVQQADKCAVYVHCLAGIGRSGLLAACLLCHWYGISGVEAMQRVSSSQGRLQ